MANNYLQPANFDLNTEDLEDVNDEIFLNTRSNSNTSAQGTYSKKSTNPFQDDKPNEFDLQEQSYLERRREVENRTLISTQKSLGILYETEEVGKATAVELAKQREQLEKTSQNLDEINSTLRFSQRHINGLKSVFGSLKNYLSGNRENSPSSNMTKSSSGSNFMPQQHQESYSENPTSMSSKAKLSLSPTERYDNHPVSRLRDDSSTYQARLQKQEVQKTDPFEAQLASNLDEMCGNITRLKFLATDLGAEIESQNELIDNMTYKIEDVDLKMTKQNNEINKLLEK